MPLSTQYGGIVGISLFGPKAINAFLLPVALEYWGQWEKKLEETNDLEQRLELQMCEQAVLVCILSDLDQPVVYFSRQFSQCAFLILSEFTGCFSKSRDNRSSRRFADKMG